ncbi:MAG TPA: hypothetical protein VGD26_06145 [Chitinophagaceae bacterium]
MRKLTCILLLLVSGALYSQDTTVYNEPYGSALTPGDEVSKGDFFLMFTVGVPSEDMKKAVKNQMGDLGFGVTIGFLSNPFSWGKHKMNSPFRIGGEIGYNYYGRFKNDYNINGYEGDFKTSYGILHTNVVLRLRPALPLKVSPFADVFGGGNFYLASIKENFSAIESALGAEETDFGSPSSGSWVKGIGAGFSISGKKQDNPNFTLRATYTIGKEIKYVERNSVMYDASSRSITYIEGRAPIRYWLIQVGISI